VAQLYPQVLGSLSVASYDSQSYGGGILTRLHTENWMTKLEVEVEVNLRPRLSRSVCLGVELLSVAHDQIFFFWLTIVFLLIWGALSDERMGL
jgi:hypothetical protein